MVASPVPNGCFLGKVVNELTNRDLIRVRATQNGVSIVCDPSVPFTALAEAIRNRLQSHSQFFKDADIKLNIGDRQVGPGDLDPIRTLLEQEFNLRLSSVVCSQQTLIKRFEADIGGPIEFSDQRLERTNPETDGETGNPVDKPIDFPDGLEETLIIRQTCRSGMTVTSPGNALILGNVNPGAEIIAQRDIIVMGFLRGAAYAGAGGDIKATIVALALEPRQLRIADCLGLPPASEDPVERSKTTTTPEIAYIEGGKIVVESYTGRYPGVSNRL